MKSPLILVINPGSMTTRVALYEEEREVAFEEIEHSRDDLSACKSYLEQLPLRKEAVYSFLDRHHARERVVAVAARGAPLKPLPGGTYRVDEKMVEDLRKENLQVLHVSMLAALIGWDIAHAQGIPAFITDPVSVDEFMPIARISGFPETPRRSLWHALNCRAVARQFAEDKGRKLTDLNLIVAHLGSGITVASFERGRTIDCTDASSESSFSPERSGTVPLQLFVKMCYSGKYTEKEMVRRIMSDAGMKAHLGTNDVIEVEKRIEDGDEKARLIYEAMAYGVCKQIGALAVALKGKIDAILLTGSIARSEKFCTLIREWVSFLGPVSVYPGQEEMKALAMGVLRVLRGEEQGKEYSNKEQSYV